jgi:hypothetical protein
MGRVLQQFAGGRRRRADAEGMRMPDYINLPDAIELCGPRVIAGWSKDGGVERRAPTRGELIAERTKIMEMPAAAILADAKATHRNLTDRLEREHALADQPLTNIDGALDKLRAEIAKLQVEVAATQDKSQKTAVLRKIAARKRTLASLEKSRAAKPIAISRSKKELVNEHRN